MSFLLFADAKATASAQLNCVHLVHTMAKLLPGWLPQPLFNVALQRWRSADLKARWACLPASCIGTAGQLLARKACVYLLQPASTCYSFACRLASASFLPLPQRLESKWLAKIMLHYVEHHHDAFAALLDMMVVFSSPMGE